jgi:hypothetical protein
MKIVNNIMFRLYNRGLDVFGEKSYCKRKKGYHVATPIHQSYVGKVASED